MNNLESIVKGIFQDSFGKPFTEVELNQLSYKATPQWDSLMQMTIITNIEEKFGLFVPFDEMMKINNFQSALNYIQSKIK